jgi:hypothetical protein
MKELLGGKDICTIPVGYESEAFRQLFEMTEGHAHCHYACTDIPVGGDPVTDYRPFGCIHDEPDKGFYSTDFDIGFISGKSISGLMVIIIHERLDADGCSFTVVGDLLM